MTECIGACIEYTVIMWSGTCNVLSIQWSSDHWSGSCIENLFPSPTVWNPVLLYIIVLCTLYLEEYTVYKLHCNSTWLYSCMVNFIILDFTIQTFPPLHRYYNRYMYMSLVHYMHISLVQYMYMHVYITCTVHLYMHMYNM